jgi:hypothetical protein
MPTQRYNTLEPYRTIPRLLDNLTAPRDSRAAVISDEESEEAEGEDSRFNRLHGNRKRRSVRAGDRPGFVPVDKEMEYYQEVHAGGSNTVADGTRSGPRLGGTGGAARHGGMKGG